MAEALRTLERLRSEAVEAARLALAEAQRAEASAEQLWHVRSAELGERERALREAHARFVAAGSLGALKATSLVLALAQRERGGCEARLAAAEGQRAAAQRAVREARERLAASERERRVVERSLERRRQAESLRQERRQEDEAEDVHRARPPA